MDITTVCISDNIGEFTKVMNERTHKYLLSIDPYLVRVLIRNSEVNILKYTNSGSSHYSLYEETTEVYLNNMETFLLAMETIDLIADCDPDIPLCENLRMFVSATTARIGALLLKDFIIKLYIKLRSVSYLLKEASCLPMDEWAALQNRKDLMLAFPETKLNDLSQILCAAVEYGYYDHLKTNTGGAITYEYIDALIYVNIKPIMYRASFEVTLSESLRYCEEIMDYFNSSAGWRIDKYVLHILSQSELNTMKYIVFDIKANGIGTLERSDMEFTDDIKAKIMNNLDTILIAAREVINVFKHCHSFKSLRNKKLFNRHTHYKSYTSYQAMIGLIRSLFCDVKTIIYAAANIIERAETMPLEEWEPLLPKERCEDIILLLQAAVRHGYFKHLRTNTGENITYNYIETIFYQLMPGTTGNFTKPAEH